MGAWIEIYYQLTIYLDKIVAPYMGAWIEIRLGVFVSSCLLVAPYMGAWIEISTIKLNKCKGDIVAPYMGAWIEILMTVSKANYYSSHPTWVRGLK